MTPGEFVAFAGQLANSQSSGAAGYRSAASRAYYGVYHTVRSLIENDLKIKIKSPGGGDNMHKLVQEYLDCCKVPEAVEISKLLGNLHSSRKAADYDIHLPGHETQVNSQACVARANSLLTKIQTCFSGTLRQKVIAGMTQHKKLRQGLH